MPMRTGPDAGSPEEHRAGGEGEDPRDRGPESIEDRLKLLREWSQSPRQFLTEAVLTDDKRSGALVPLRPKASQEGILRSIERQLKKRGYARIAVCKVRQLGSSALGSALMLWVCTFQRNVVAGVVAHDDETAKAIFERVIMMWENLPAWMRPEAKYQGKDWLDLKDTGSRFRVWTAGNVRGHLARGRTVRALLASEVSYWPESTARRAHNSAMNAVPERSPGSIVIYETTANGRGNFWHRFWTLVESGSTDFEPVFVGFFDEPEYTDKASRDDEAALRRTIKGMAAEQVSQVEIVEMAEHLGLLPDDIMLAKTDERWTVGRLRWRRRVLRTKCDDDPDLFSTEYPTTAEEAFVATAGNVFSGSFLRLLEADALPPTTYALAEVPDSRGAWRGIGNETAMRLVQAPKMRHTDTAEIYVAPVEDHVYVLGVDTSLGLEGAKLSLSCIEVLDRVTREQVAEFAGHADPVSLARWTIALSHYYGDAIAAVEVEGPAGTATLQELLRLRFAKLYRRRQYDRVTNAWKESLGWSTNTATRRQMVADAVYRIRSGDARLRGVPLIRELAHLEATDRNRIEADSRREGVKDDRFMAFAIAWQVNQDLGDVQSYVEMHKKERRQARLPTREEFIVEATANYWEDQEPASVLDRY